MRLPPVAHQFPGIRTKMPVQPGCESHNLRPRMTSQAGKVQDLLLRQEPRAAAWIGRRDAFDTAASASAFVPEPRQSFLGDRRCPASKARAAGLVHFHELCCGSALLWPPKGGPNVIGVQGTGRGEETRARRCAAVCGGVRRCAVSRRSPWC